MTTDLTLAARAFALSLIVSGCSFAPRKPFTPNPPPPASAAVYFYRPSEMTGRLIRPTIQINGAKAGRLANDSYGVAYVPPGEVTARSTWPGIPGSIRDDSAVVHAEAGRSYYLRVRYHVGKPKSAAGPLVWEDRMGLEEVSEADAVPQLAGLERNAEFGSSQ